MAEASHRHARPAEGAGIRKQIHLASPCKGVCDHEALSGSMETFQSVLYLGKKIRPMVTLRVCRFSKVHVGIKSPSPHEKPSSSKSGWATRDAHVPTSARCLSAPLPQPVSSPQEVDLTLFQSHLRPVFSLLSPATSLSSLRELGRLFLRDIESRPSLRPQGTRRAVPSGPPTFCCPHPSAGRGSGAHPGPASFPLVCALLCSLDSQWPRVRQQTVCGFK